MNDNKTASYFSHVDREALGEFAGLVLADFNESLLQCLQRHQPPADATKAEAQATIVLVWLTALATALSQDILDRNLNPEEVLQQIVDVDLREMLAAAITAHFAEPHEAQRPS